MINNLTRLEAFFAERGFETPKIPLLQPTNAFLDTAGEELRRRIFITTDGAGRSLCLRPEFTIPVCLAALGRGVKSAKYAYGGNVFRQNESGAAEFLQSGIEMIGADDVIAGDVETISTAIDALGHCGARDLRVVIGDQALFDGLLVALELPEAWRQRLLRGFGDGRKLEHDLLSIGASDERIGGLMDEALAEALQANDQQQVEAIIAKKMQVANLPASGGRTAGDIASRMISKAELAASRLSDHQCECLQRFLNLETGLGNAVAQLRQFANEERLDLGEPIGKFEARTNALLGRRQEGVKIVWQARFGRPLDYYTGIVFEVFEGNFEAPVCGGGRYDHLMNMLGSKTEIPAIGFSIFLDRLREAGQ